MHRPRLPWSTSLASFHLSGLAMMAVLLTARLASAGIDNGGDGTAASHLHAQHHKFASVTDPLSKHVPDRQGMCRTTPDAGSADHQQPAAAGSARRLLGAGSQQQQGRRELAATAVPTGACGGFDFCPSALAAAQVGRGDGPWVGLGWVGWVGWGGGCLRAPA